MKGGRRYELNKRGLDTRARLLDVDPEQLHRVRCLFSTEIRGLSNEWQIGFTSDLDAARAALTDAVATLLTQPRPERQSHTAIFS